MASSRAQPYRRASSLRVEILNVIRNASSEVLIRHVLFSNLHAILRQDLHQAPSRLILLLFDLVLIDAFAFLSMRRWISAFIVIVVGLDVHHSALGRWLGGGCFPTVEFARWGLKARNEGEEIAGEPKEEGGRTRSVRRGGAPTHGLRRGHFRGSRRKVHPGSFRWQHG